MFALSAVIAHCSKTYTQILSEVFYELSICGIMLALSAVIAHCSKTYTQILSEVFYELSICGIMKSV